MAEKPEKPDLAWRIIGGLVALAAGFLARKLIEFGWHKATGNKPPADVEDPELRLSEALGFAVVMGVGMEVARILATRAAAKRWRRLSVAPDED